MKKPALELDEAAEEEFYSIIDYYKQFDHSLSSDLFKNSKELLSIYGPNAGSPYLHDTNSLFSSGFLTQLFTRFIEKR